MALSRHMDCRSIGRLSIAGKPILRDARQRRSLCYTHAANTWATVTPVVLPGYDDPGHLRRREKNGRVLPEQQRRILERLSNRIDALVAKQSFRLVFLRNWRITPRLSGAKSDFGPELNWRTATGYRTTSSAFRAFMSGFNGATLKVRRSRFPVPSALAVAVFTAWVSSQPGDLRRVRSNE